MLPLWRLPGMLGTSLIPATPQTPPQLLAFHFRRDDLMAIGVTYIALVPPPSPGRTRIVFKIRIVQLQRSMFRPERLALWKRYLASWAHNPVGRFSVLTMPS